MHEVSKLLCLLIMHIMQIDSRLLPSTTNFEKVVTFDSKYTLIADPPTTSRGSFVYAACEQSSTNVEKNCTLVLETPIVPDAAYKNTCSVNIAVDNPSYESVTNLELYSFNEDTVLLSWLVESERYEYFGKVRILKMTKCEFVDLIIPANHVPYVLTRSVNFDVIVANETYCGSEFCKDSYNTDGKKIEGPIQIIDESNYNSTYQGINLTQEEATALVADVMCWQTLMIDLNFDGKKTDALWLTSLCHYRLSTANNFISVCVLKGQTNVTCMMYDEHMNLKMDVKFKYADGKSKRWLQPYNLKDGTMLVVTGIPSDVDGKRYDTYSVIKFRENERKGRPLEIAGVNFECNSNSLRVVVSENEAGDICFHFICDRLERYHSHIKSSIKFATKCLSDSI